MGRAEEMAQVAAAATAAQCTGGIVLVTAEPGGGKSTLLMEAVAAGLAGQPVLIMAAYRPAETSAELEQALAALAHRSPARLALAGLSGADAAALISSVCDGPIAAEVAASIAERTGGNPFYLKESSKLLASEGALVAVSEVPEGVRDVLRRRLARLPLPAVAVLRLAAVMGRDADVEVLAEAADIDEVGVIDGLEIGVMAGLLTEPAPGRVRVVHALVRDTVYADLTGLRRARMHARLAAALLRRQPDNLTALAYHYARAGSAETAAAAVEYGVRAAELADLRYAYDSAVSPHTQAVDACDRLTGPSGEVAGRRVALLGRLLRAQIRAGRIADARTTRQRAVEAAESAGRDDLVTAAFTASSEPTPWQTRPYGFIDEQAVGTLERLLSRADLGDVARCKLLAALVVELNGEDDPRPGQAAAEAIAIARRLADPDLLHWRCPPVDLTFGELCLLAGLAERADGYFAAAGQLARRRRTRHKPPGGGGSCSHPRSMQPAKANTGGCQAETAGYRLPRQRARRANPARPRRSVERLVPIAQPQLPPDPAGVVQGLRRAFILPCV